MRSVTSSSAALSNQLPAAGPPSSSLSPGRVIRKSTSATAAGRVGAVFQAADGSRMPRARPIATIPKASDTMTTAMTTM